MNTPKSLSHLAPGVQCPHPRPSPGIWIPGNSQSPRDSHPPPAQRCFWGQAAFPRSSGPCWPRQHAENKNHLPHLCFPGRGIGKGETERETNSSVYLSVHGSSSLGCSSQTDPLLQGPSLLHPSLLHPVPLPWDRAAGWAVSPNPAPPLCHKSLLGELSLCLESHRGLCMPGTAPSTLPSLFSPSCTCYKWAAPLAALFLLNSHCFCTGMGFNIPAHPQGPGQRATAEGFTGGAQVLGSGQPG